MQIREGIIDLLLDDQEPVAVLEAAHGVEMGLAAVIGLAGDNNVVPAFLDRLPEKVLAAAAGLYIVLGFGLKFSVFIKNKSEASLSQAKILDQ